jgi:hypothetical protein
VQPPPTPDPQEPPAPTQPAPGQPAPGQPDPATGGVPVPAGRVIAADAGVIFIPVKSERTADFEKIMAKLQEALAASEDPVRKEQAAGWKVFKSSQMAQGNAVYIFLISPVVKGQEYDLPRLIAEVFPVEVQEVFAKYKDAFAGRAITSLNALMTMQ